MAPTHRLDRSISIRAERDTVFRFFTDSTRWAAWWGAGSTIDARPGGRLLIRYPDGTEAAGEVLDMVAPERLTFSYGFVSGKPFPAGGSRVTIRLEPDGAGTRLLLSHELPDAALRDEFMQGWRHQLALFSNAVANDVNAGATASVDDWFASWREADVAVREQLLARIAVTGVQFRDRFGCTDGIADLLPHISAAQRFMPNMHMQRHGDIRHCQGTALADWVALDGGGQERAAGTNVFVFGPNGRIESVTGFWGK